MASFFPNAFATWKNGEYRSKVWVRNLSEILKQAADLGIWLFSQPSAIRFDWPALTPLPTKQIVTRFGQGDGWEGNTIERRTSPRGAGDRGIRLILDRYGVLSLCVAPLRWH